MYIPMPEQVRYIINQIEEAGFYAYVVGGCVRDSILCRNPTDWDITCSATPTQVKAIFPRTLDTGIKHGTVTVMMGKQGYEVTTFRIDGVYEDSRHPKEVVFTPSLLSDLQRRDFTINAMAYNDKVGLVDIFGGLKDISAGIIRCVGRAHERFTEDALRMMRAIRFSAQLGYDIEDRTRWAIFELSPTLKQISVERIQTELVKILCSDNPDYIENAYLLGITKAIMPEFDRIMEKFNCGPFYDGSVGEHSIRALKEVPGDKELRLAMLLHEIGKSEIYAKAGEEMTPQYYARAGERITIRILKRLKFDNQTIHMVSRLVRYHSYGDEAKIDKPWVRKAIYELGEDLFPRLFEVIRADILAHTDYKRKERLEKLNLWQELYQEVIQNGDCLSLKDLAVNGNDLTLAGIKPGKELGETLNRLLLLVLEHPEYNKKDYLINLVFHGK